MKKLKPLSTVLLAFCLTTTGCYEQIVSPLRTVENKTIFNPDRDLPEKITGNSPWQYASPTIIKHEFIPSYDLFDHTKCFAWRITWPVYQASADDNKIPTVFATVNGALNSFQYLNATNANNTYKTDFSLYYGDQVEASAGMWEELDYADVSDMEVPYFASSNQSLDNIIDWVTERPELFELYWPGGGANELSYSEGDFIQFHLSKADLYGGIRIVSMNPRIIEVYLAVPNI